jgi:co-chaperonin GroES (HSP10)
MRIKPMGSQLLIKIMKKKSSIELLPGTSQADEEAEATVVELGTSGNLGIKVGHNVMFKYGTKPVIVEDTPDYDLLIVPEVSILYVKNWSESDDVSLEK